MKLIPKFKFFAKAADGEMRMIPAESMDLTNGFSIIAIMIIR